MNSLIIQFLFNLANILRLRCEHRVRRAIVTGAKLLVAMVTPRAPTFYVNSKRFVKMLREGGFFNRQVIDVLSKYIFKAPRKKDILR